MSYLPINNFKSHLNKALQRASGSFQQDSLKGKIFKNVGWMSVGYFVEIVIRFISSMILTRLLSPHDYGMMDTVLVFATFVGMISDLGVRPLVVADPRGDDKDFLGAIWTLQVIRGFLLGTVLIGIALTWKMGMGNGWIGPESQYANPLLPNLLLLISFSVMINGFSSLNEYRMIRNLKRGSVSVIDISTRIGAVICSVTFVYIFRSVWVLAAVMVFASTLRVTLTHWKLEGPAMTFRTDRKELLAILSHSRWVAANSALTVMTSQADKVLIGYAFGFQVLGTYSIATSLFLTLTRLVSQIQAGVGLPVQRALLDQPPATRRRNYYRFRLPFDLYCLVVGVSMTLLGPLLFGLAYDERYQLSGVLFAFLGMKVALMPLLQAGSVLYADLRYKMMMAIGVVRSTVFLSAMAAAVYFHSIKFMVLAIALEKLPDIVLYFTVKKAGVFFDIKRDGIIIAIVAAQCAYLLTFH